MNRVIAILGLLAGCLAASQVEAAVAVIANRTAAEVKFATAWPDGKVQQYTLSTGDMAVVPMDDKLTVAYRVDENVLQLAAAPNTIYYFVTREDKLQLARVALPEVDSEKAPKITVRSGSGKAQPKVNSAAMLVVPVMILVDDNEPAVRRLWEARLRERMAKASEVFEQYCRVRFEVKAVGRWVSDNRIYNFDKSLREFETMVNPAPALLAIGFTSQYQMPRGRTHLGGTRGPLNSHILIREWAQHVTKTERLELLIHELGHYLGAVHSVESHSVMRPVLGDRLSHAKSFQIRFDPANTLAMNLVADELRTGRTRYFCFLSRDTKALLRRVYTALKKTMPFDQAAKGYLAMLDQRLVHRVESTQNPKSLIDGTRSVLDAIVEAAGENQQAEQPLTGDRLTEHLVRHAAATAAKLSDEVAAKAFLLGLGIAMDETAKLRYASAASSICREAETNRQRQERLKVLGSPTMRESRDLTRSFATSAALTVVLGAKVSESNAVQAELKDARRPTGFSFVDLSANLAGIAFAGYVTAGKLPLEHIAESFTVEAFLPAGEGLVEGLTWDEFFAKYSSTQGDRFHEQQMALRKRILASPGYQNL